MYYEKEIKNSKGQRKSVAEMDNNRAWGFFPKTEQYTFMGERGPGIQMGLARSCSVIQVMIEKIALFVKKKYKGGKDISHILQEMKK